MSEFRYFSISIELIKNIDSRKSATAGLQSDSITILVFTENYRHLQRSFVSSPEPKAQYDLL